MAAGGILIALDSAFFTHEGQPVTITRGKTTVREGHPILKGRENLFGPITVDFELPAAPAKTPAKTA